MLLGKSCKKEHNIKNGTLKLGTLHEYRTTETEEIADKNEGMLTFNLIFDGIVEIDAIWLNTITNGAIALDSNEPSIQLPGKLHAHIKKMHVLYQDNNIMTIRDSEVIIQREALNSFIFCMSSIRKMRDCAEIFKGYDDYWYLMNSRAQRFGVTLGGMLLDKIKNDHRNEINILPNGTDIDNLKIHMEHSHIKYTPREIHITNSSTYKAIDFIKHMKSMAFIKPAKFKPEQEYRFNYTITSNGTIIQPTVKSLYLNSSPLLGLII
ncbi:hypothetical protein [Pseudomonas fragi]|uniref:hypothetical protein n=1 Tax=Pseudomonas fragi TaxID=296 RepID=UPI001F17FD5B|nr:hypothetical protein [Pseudomonas fragi]MCF6764017.1 hypothetical protein [Pseudomonas fragi]